MAKEGGSTEGGGKAKETAASTAVGAASVAIFGLLSGLLTPSRPNPTYINFVNRCLNERGYDVTRWE